MAEKEKEEREINQRKVLSQPGILSFIVRKLLIH
jgi:hypothetical protein